MALSVGYGAGLRVLEQLIIRAASENQDWGYDRIAGAMGQSRVSKVLLIGERSLRLALGEYVAHYHAEHNHQGKDNVLLFPRDTQTGRGGPVQCRERAGELLHYYHEEAAQPGGKVLDDPVAGGRLHGCKDNYAAGKRPGAL